MKMSLGNFIAQLRKENNLTQKQLSEILGVSDKTVSHWEREESAPDISILPLLADTLGVTVDELLAGERKINDATETVIPDANLTTQNSENDFYRFKQKNTVTSLLSIVFGLSGTVVLCLLNYTLSFNADFYYAARIVSVVLLSLNMTVQGALAIYARITYSGYINKCGGESNRKTAIRLATLTYYPAFFFIPVLIGSTDPVSSWNPYAALVFAFIITSVILIIAEMCLIKKGLIPKWKKQTFGKLLNSVLGLTIAAVLLTGSFIANTSYAYKDIIYDMAECTEFQTTEEFIEYIEKDVPVPDEISSIKDRYTKYTNIGEIYFLPLWGTSQNPLLFHWNNGEICSIIPTDEDIVPIKCYTHQALIEAEDKADTKIAFTRLGLFLLYPLSIAIAISVYLAIKKKMKLG